MTKKKKKNGQLELIDVGPDNLDRIRPHVEAYRAAVEEYSQLGQQVNTEKQAIIQLVTEAKLKPLANGNIEFTCDNVLIKIVPTELKIKITKPKAPNVD